MVADVDNDRDKATTGCEKPKTSAFSLISTEPRVSAAKRRLVELSPDLRGDAD